MFSMKVAIMIPVRAASSSESSYNVKNIDLYLKRFALVFEYNLNIKLLYFYGIYIFLIYILKT